MQTLEAQPNSRNLWPTWNDTDIENVLPMDWPGAVENNDLLIRNVKIIQKIYARMGGKPIAWKEEAGVSSSLSLTSDYFRPINAFGGGASQGQHSGYNGSLLSDAENIANGWRQSHGQKPPATMSLKSFVAKLLVASVNKDARLGLIISLDPSNPTLFEGNSRDAEMIWASESGANEEKKEQEMQSMEVKKNMQPDEAIEKILETSNCKSPAKGEY
ncbi:hypothetical protein BT96DRAFT_976054 [Gymnopus androsaceus JB14]|uniref:Uncharacterized protein n=1 Tax=Gymnopus androsaceus JB14 TaxID=1447944 RepID=A0A6A4HNB7_9AGAR|nr:hypothetical protein BT96DRAFT_976054 [Gymnopus androsaceus JB14]